VKLILVTLAQEKTVDYKSLLQGPMAKSEDGDLQSSEKRQAFLVRGEVCPYLGVRWVSLVKEKNDV
jgi:hypothetical protein